MWSAAAAPSQDAQRLAAVRTGHDPERTEHLADERVRKRATDWVGAHDAQCRSRMWLARPADGRPGRDAGNPPPGLGAPVRSVVGEGHERRVVPAARRAPITTAPSRDGHA